MKPYNISKKNAEQDYEIEEKKVELKEDEEELTNDEIRAKKKYISWKNFVGIIKNFAYLTMIFCFLLAMLDRAAIPNKYQTYQAINTYLQLQSVQFKNGSLFYTDTFFTTIYEKFNLMASLTDNLEILDYFQMYQIRGDSIVCLTADPDFLHYLTRLGETCRKGWFWIIILDFALSERNSTTYSIFNEIQPQPIPIYESYIRGYIMDTRGFYASLENINSNSINSALGLVSRKYIDQYTRVLVVTFNILCRHLDTLTQINSVFDLSNYDDIRLYNNVNIVNIKHPDDLTNKFYFLIGVIIAAVLLSTSLLELIAINQHYVMYWKHVKFAKFISILGYFYFKIPTLFELIS